MTSRRRRLRRKRCPPNKVLDEHFEYSFPKRRPIKRKPMRKPKRVVSNVKGGKKIKKQWLSNLLRPLSDRNFWQPKVLVKKLEADKDIKIHQESSQKKPRIMVLRSDASRIEYTSPHKGSKRIDYGSARNIISRDPGVGNKHIAAKVSKVHYSRSETVRRTPDDSHIASSGGSSNGYVAESKDGTVEWKKPGRTPKRADKRKHRSSALKKGSHVSSSEAAEALNDDAREVESNLHLEKRVKSSPAPKSKSGHESKVLLGASGSPHLSLSRFKTNDAVSEDVTVAHLEQSFSSDPGDLPLLQEDAFNNEEVNSQDIEVGLESSSSKEVEEAEQSVKVIHSSMGRENDTETGSGEAGHSSYQLVCGHDDDNNVDEISNIFNLDVNEDLFNVDEHISDTQKKGEFVSWTFLKMQNLLNYSTAYRDYAYRVKEEVNKLLTQLKIRDFEIARLKQRLERYEST